MEKHKHNRARINFSIKTGFQVKLLFNILVIVLLSTAVTSAVFYFYADREIGNSFKQFHVTARNFQDYLLPAILFSGVFGLVIGSVIAIFFPHKFAGPLYRMERDLKTRICEERDLSLRFNLRNGDEFKDLALTLNDVIESFSSNIKEIKKISDNLSVLVSNGKYSAEDLKKIQLELEHLANKYST